MANTLHFTDISVMIKNNNHPPITRVVHLYQEQDTWLHWVQFYMNEMELFAGRLQELSSAPAGYFDLEVLKHLSQQNKGQRKNMRAFLRDIRMAKDILSQYAQEHPLSSDDYFVEDHFRQRFQFEKMKKAYRNFKDAFEAAIS